MTKAERELLLYVARSYLSELAPYTSKAMIIASYIDTVYIEEDACIVTPHGTPHVHDFSFRHISNPLYEHASTGQCKCGKSKLYYDYETLPLLPLRKVRNNVY